MSTVNANSFKDASGGSNAVLYGVAAPTNSMGFRNRIINGDMRIDQRNAGASVTVPNTNVTATWSVDRWRMLSTQASKFAVQQNAGSVTPPSGFINYMGATSASAYSVLTGDVFGFYQPIEGFNTADLGWGAAGAQTITLSFWVRSSLTGTFGGAIRNSAGNRSYPFSYTISAANTWELETITIPGDTSGTWLTTNSAGIVLVFGLGAGATYNGTAGAWAAGDFYSATGATSVIGTSGATFYITGVQLEAGSVASPFERRAYGTELALCQRYYQKWDYSAALGSPGATALVATKYSLTDAMISNIPLNSPMRTSPTLASTNATARAVLNTGAGFTATISAISAGVASSGLNVAGAITITCANNALAAGFGWLDQLGVVSASAEL